MMHLPLHQIIPTQPPRLYDRVIVPAASSSSSPGSILSTSRHTNTVHIHSLLDPGLKRRHSVPLGRHFRGWRISSVRPIEGSNLVFVVVTQRSKRRSSNAQHQRESSTGSSSAGQDNTRSSAPNKLVLFDLRAAAPVIELLLGSELILSVAVRTDKLAVVLRRRVLLYHLDLDAQERARILTREGEWETCENPLGLASMATSPSSSHLVIPGRQAGHVQLVRLPPCPPLVSDSPQSGQEDASVAGPSRPHPTNSPSRTSAPSTTATTTMATATPPPYPIVHIFLAHTSPLRTLHLSSTGELLLTSSEKGTLLRVFATSPALKYAMLRELRRGSDSADTWDAGFADPTRGIQVFGVSDKETVHVWNVGDLASQSASAPSPSHTTQHRQHRQQQKGKMREGTSSAMATAPLQPPQKAAGIFEGKDRALNLLRPYLPVYFQSTWSGTIWRIPKNTSMWSISSASALSGSGGTASSMGEGAFTLISPSTFAAALGGMTQRKKDVGANAGESSVSPTQRTRTTDHRGEAVDPEDGDDDDLLEALRDGSSQVRFAQQQHAGTASTASSSTARPSRPYPGPGEQTAGRTNDQDDVAKCIFVAPKANAATDDTRHLQHHHYE